MRWCVQPRKTASILVEQEWQRIGPRARGVDGRRRGESG